jgi:HlyD family secretion protein
MVCVAEVHESDRARLRIGQMASIRSAALSKPLVGKIERIDRLVGSPMMRDPNPLARTDYRAVPVRIRLEQADAAAAAELVQLQVDVEITTNP